MEPILIDGVFSIKLPLKVGIVVVDVLLWGIIGHYDCNPRRLVMMTR